MTAYKKNNITYGEVAQKARENAAQFSEAVIGESPTYKSSTEIRFFENKSLVVHTAGSKQGLFSNHSDETAYGDMLQLCTYIRGMSKYDALLYAQSVLGISEGSLENAANPLIKQKTEEEKEREALQEKQKKIRTANWIWNSSSPTEGKTEGEAYLKNRGLTGPFDSNLIRFRILSPEDLKKMGAKDSHIPKTPVVSVVFKATNAAGEITAVQQIITTQGKKLSQVMPGFEPDKRTNGYLTGSAVKFGGERPERVVLAEGPETSMSIFEVTKIPTWITLGTSNYTTLEMPKTVKEVIVAADMEPSGVGLGSALRAAQHWENVGVPKVGIALPRLDNGDCNDVHTKQGTKALQHMFDTTFYSTKKRAPDSVLVTADARSAFHVWQKTGIETVVRVPGKKQNTQERFPISLDGIVEERHKTVLLIQRPGFKIIDENIKKERPDLVILNISENGDKYRELAKTPNFVEKSISDVIDIYAPGGTGEKEPMAFCLRKDDAKSLHEAGHKAIAIRASGLDTVDLSFMKNRKAFVCPIGTGTPEDKKLSDSLKANGAEVTQLVWQLFKPDQDGYKMVRSSIPNTYGAKDAVNEGWKGEKMKHLLSVSKTAQQDAEISIEKKTKVKSKQETR